MNSNTVVDHENQTHQLQEIIASSSIKSFNHGRRAERNRITEMLKSYFDLTQEPNEDGEPLEETPENKAWDSGFQAALALITNNYNHG